MTQTPDWDHELCLNNKTISVRCQPCAAFTATLKQVTRYISKYLDEHCEDCQFLTPRRVNLCASFQAY